MKVHEKIRFLRESKDWSQEEMAEKLNMSVSGYSKIERGETKAYIPKLEQIAEILEMDLMELMSLGEKHIFLLNSNHGDGCNIIGSSKEAASEIEKLQLIITHHKVTIEQKDIEIANLKEIIELLKNKSA